MPPGDLLVCQEYTKPKNNHGSYFSIFILKDFGKNYFSNKTGTYTIKFNIFHDF